MATVEREYKTCDPWVRFRVQRANGEWVRVWARTSDHAAEYVRLVLDAR